MTTLDTTSRARRLFVVGIAFLVVAIAAPRFFPTPAAGAESLYDGLRGLAFGIAIGTLLLSVWRGSRRANAGQG